MNVMPEVNTVKELSFDEWEFHWEQVTKANMLQSWQYGSAKEEAEGWRVFRFLFSDNKGLPVAIAQILTRSFPLLGSIARLNRGPLLLDKFPEDQNTERILEVIREILNEAKRRRWWIIQIAPELTENEKVLIGLTQMGLRKQPTPSWASGRLSLCKDENSLLMSLDGKWRNLLRKGERLGVEVKHIDGTNVDPNRLMSGYMEFQQSKGFEGLNESLLRKMISQNGKTWQFDIFISTSANSSDPNEQIGMLVAVRHGDTETYLIGFTNDQGRQMQANSVMLWHAILHAKANGCEWFDIGGLSVTTPKGIADFKKGLNAELYTLVGEFRGYLLPWRNFINNILSVSI